MYGDKDYETLFIATFLGGRRGFLGGSKQQTYFFLGGGAAYVTMHIINRDSRKSQQKWHTFVKIAKIMASFKQ